MTWGRNSFQDRVDAAMDFINSGRTDSYRSTSGGWIGDNGGNWANQGGTLCTSSSQCGSGYSCIGGRCIPPTESGSGSGGGTGSGNSSASCPPDPSPVPPPPDQDCGTTGPTSDAGPCSSPGCGGAGGGGGNGYAEECCGTRCCRIGGFGVQCYCGDCPPPGRCQEYCDAFYKVNYRQAEGCSKPTICSECEYCSTIAPFALCRPYQSGGPCHCGGSNGCSGQCETCKEDGTCEYNCNNCTSCITLYNQLCNCLSGPRYVTIRCCTSTCNENNLSFVKCREDGCNNPSVCPPTDPPKSDPCKGDCYTRTCCVEGGPPECDFPPCVQPPSCPPCPPNSSCRNLGYISAGDETCYIEEVCDKSNVPDSCGECDCNCQDDCPDCQYCDANGTCQPDPDCCDEEDEYLLYKRTWLRGATVTQSYSWGPLACDNNPPGYFSTGEPCRVKCRTKENETEESSIYLCYQRSQGVRVESRPANFVGYDGLGCCKDNPGTEYYLVTKEGNRISNSSVYINGGSSASGGGLQNNCFNGGYHTFELVDTKCNSCPDEPS